MAVASVFRLQHIFSIPAWPQLDETTRIISSVSGILTVFGLYLLAKKLFNWQIAALSSYLMAISFWHVNLSRSDSPAITALLMLVWGVFFIWQGLTTNKLHNFAVSGIFWGLGFYTYWTFNIMPLIIALTLLAYWHSIKKDFGHEKYLYIRNQIVRGLALFLITVILIALPIGYYFWKNPAHFINSIIFSKNIFQVLGIFNFGEIDGMGPLLLWPVGLFFILGFLKSLIKFIKIKKIHGHFPTVQVLLFSWFLAGLAPAIFSNDRPGALIVLLTAPVVFIWAGEGLWWIMDKIGDWYYARDVHEYRFQHKWLRESSFIALLALIIFLSSLTVVEYDKYFNKWAKITGSLMLKK